MGQEVQRWPTVEEAQNLIRRLHVYEEMVPPMTAFGTHARWRIQWQEASPVELYQLSPQICDPARHVLPFIRDIAAKLCREDGVFEPVKTLVVPGDDAAGEPMSHRREISEMLYNDPFVRVMYAFWPEMAKSAPRGAVAYDWEVWYGPGYCEVAFKRYGVDGRSVPVHTVSRKTIDEAIEELSINRDFGIILEGI